ncbi:MAG: carboxyl transferase domain-containing protein, partial [Acidimicrobiales bacterium]
MTVPIRAQASPLVSARTARLGERSVVLATVSPDTAEPALTIADGATLAAAIRSARDQRLPFVGVLQTTGVPFDEGIGGSDSWARAARELVLSSGVIPTMFTACGPVVSGPALLLGLADVTIFTENAYAYVTGPKSVEAYTGVPVSGSELGGASAHLRSTGVASMVVPDVDAALEAIADVLVYLPNSVDSLPEPLPTDDPVDRETPEAGELLPDSAAGSYDVRALIRILADDDDFLELRGAGAPNLVTGFASL